MSAYTLFANAFLAVGGFVVALFAIGAIVAFGFHLYLAFEGFVAAKFAQDAGADWSDPYGDIPAPIPTECVDAFHARSYEQ